MVFQDYALYAQERAGQHRLRLRIASISHPTRSPHGRRGGEGAEDRPFCSTGSRASLRGRPAPGVSPWGARSCAIRRSSCSTKRSPTSDAQLRAEMRVEIKKLHQRFANGRLRDPRPGSRPYAGRPHRGHEGRPCRADLAPPMRSTTGAPLSSSPASRARRR